MTSTAPPGESLLSPQGLADHLGVPVQTVYEWRKARSKTDGPPSFLVGGRPRYRLSEVEAWLESRREQRKTA